MTVEKAFPRKREMPPQGAFLAILINSSEGISTVRLNAARRSD